MPTKPRSVLITGASSGIGKALAREYAAAGVHLALVGRNPARLEEIATLCRDMGATVTTGQVDVRDRNGLSAWIRATDDEYPIDLTIANAGITGGTGMGRLRENPDIARNVFATNLVGAINTIDPLVERMSARGHGRIAVVGSISAVRGLPYCPSYSASKAAIHAYAESLRSALAPLGVGVTIIAPGFVATSLNEKTVCPKPLQTSAERAARRIRQGLDRGKPMIVFPRVLYYGLLLSYLLPRRLTDTLFNHVHVDVPEEFD